MKLRIDIEKKSYEVTVEFLEDAHNGHRDWHAGEIAIPESVTRPRPPVKLLEDTFCRSPIAGRISAVLAVSGPAVDGVLKTIQVKPGESVSTGQLLFELI